MQFLENRDLTYIWCKNTCLIYALLFWLQTIPWKSYSFDILQSPLVIVDSSVSGKLSTIMRESTITRETQAKIDIWSTQSIHYNERIHY